MGKLTEAFHAFAETFKRPPMTKPVGYPSPANMGGYVDDDTFEYAAKWRDRTQRMELIRQMRMGHVDTALLWHIPLICMNAAEPQVEKAKAPDDAPEEIKKRYEEQAALVEWNLFENPPAMRDSWAQLLMEMSLFMPDGFWCGEMDWRNHKEKQIDGLPVRYLHWIHWRTPDSIAADGWKVDDKTGELVGVQQDPGIGTNQTATPGLMKAENLLLLTHRRLGNNFEGESIYRPVHKDFDMQFHNEKTECVVNERMSGLLALEWDKEMDVEWRPEKDGKDLQLYVNGQSYSKLVDMMKGILAHKQNYAIPGPFRIRMVTPEGTPVDVGPAIERHKHAIMQSGILHFLTLGATPHGSYSAGDLMEHPFTNFINSRLDYIYGKWNKSIVRKLIDSNWPRDETTQYPKVKAKFTREDLKRVSEVFKNIFATPSGDPEWQTAEYKKTYKHLSGIFGWPEPEDTEAEKTAKAKAPGGTPGEGDPKEEPTEKRTEFREWKPYRPLRPQEEHVAFADIVATLDKHREGLTKRLDKIRNKRIAWVKKTIGGMSEKELRKPEIIKPEEMPYKDEYRKAAKGYLVNVLNYGRQQVRSELTKLGKKVAAWEAFAEPFKWPVKKITYIGDVEGHSHTHLSEFHVFQEFTEDAFLDYLAEQIELWGTGTMVGSILSNARDKVSRGATAAAVAAAVASALAALSFNARAQELGKYVNNSFGWGREDEMSRNKGQFKNVERTEVGDDNVCDWCREHDGDTYAYGSAEHIAARLPDPNCAGGPGACRGMHMVT